MLMIRAIVRPEKATEVMLELSDAGYPAVTKLDVVGRGKQRGVKVGDIHYDEIPKEMLLMVVKDDMSKDEVISIIKRVAKTGSGKYGDGKIFVSEVLESYTISNGKAEL